MHNAYTVHWVYNALFTTWCLFIFLFPGATSFPFFFSSLSEKPQFEKFSHLWVPLCVEAVDVWLWVLRSVEVKYINQSNPPSLLWSCIDAIDALSAMKFAIADLPCFIYKTNRNLLYIQYNTARSRHFRTFEQFEYLCKNELIFKLF